MKIYNEIILSWNDKTKQFDTIYEDSFNHIGDVMQLQDYGGGSGGSTPGSSGNTGGSGGPGGNNNDMTQNTDDAYSQLWENENMQEYREALSNRISHLILNRFGEIETILGIEGIENIQKTFRDGQLISGRNKSEMMVVYEYDNDANKDDAVVIDSVVNWANFLHPSLIGLNITVNSTQGEDGTETSGIILELTAPNDSQPLNINSVVSELDLTNVNLKNNASQFYEIDTVKTNIDRSKLSDFVDTEFSELTPNTFTHLLEKYQQAKNELPFFRYRADDFFEEWNNAGQDLPIQYRLKKFFEEFEKIKEDIPDGGFGYNAVTIKAEGTSFYQVEGDTITSPKKPRKLSIIEKNGTEKIIYSSTSGRGHRITVFPQESFVNGKWNGIFKYDRVYDTYAGTTLENFNSNYATPDGGLEEADNLARHISDGFPDGTTLIDTDLIVLTSYDAVRYSPLLKNVLKSIGAREPRVVQSEGFADLESLEPDILAEYTFNVPSHTQVAQGIYSSASSLTKPKHIILKNQGIIDNELQIGPGRIDGGGSNTLNEIVEVRGPGRFNKSAIRQTRANRETEYQIDAYGLKPDTEYVLELWMGVAGQTNGVFLTSNGLSRQCEYHREIGDGYDNDWCGAHDYAGSPEQDVIFQTLGGYERAPSDYFIQGDSYFSNPPAWWEANYPELGNILENEGTDKIGTIKLHNVFVSETNYGNTHSPHTSTWTPEMQQAGNFYEFYTLHKSQDDSAHFIAEKIAAGAPFSSDDSGIYKITYCYGLPNGHSGCPGEDFGLGHRYDLRAKWLGDNLASNVFFPDISNFKPFHSRAFSGYQSTSNQGEAPTIELSGDNTIGELIETLSFFDNVGDDGGFANAPTTQWQKRKAVIRTPESSQYIGDGGGEGILHWYVGYGNGTGCDYIEISQPSTNHDTYIELPDNNIDCDFVWGEEALPQSNNFRVQCDNGDLHVLHYGTALSNRLITSDGTGAEGGYGPDLLFQTSYGYYNGLNVDTWFINHNGSYGCNVCEVGTDEPTNPSWWDSLPEVRDLLLQGPYGTDNRGQIALDNLVMFETNTNADWQTSTSAYPYELWNEIGQKLELFNTSLGIHFIMEKVYTSGELAPFGSDNTGVWKIIHCYEGGCPGWYGAGLSLNANYVLSGEGYPDSFPMGTGFTANEICQNSALTNNQIYYTDFKIYENNIEEIYDGYHFNGVTPNGEYKATSFFDTSGNGNNLRLISNDVNWIFTPERGWSLFFPGSGNERLQDEKTLEISTNSVFNGHGGGYDYFTSYDTLDATKNIDNPGNELTIMFEMYVTEYGTYKARHQVILSKSEQYQIGICNSNMPSNVHNCLPGEIVWALKLEGETNFDLDRHMIGTNYVVPLNLWTHIALTYDGVEGVKIYVDGQLVSTATHSVDGNLDVTDDFGNTSKLTYTAPTDEGFVKSSSYIQNKNIAAFGNPFSIGAGLAKQGSNPGNGNFENVLTNASLGKISISKKALTREQISALSGELVTQLGFARQRTPYTLIGSPQFNEGDGIEVVTEASPDADLATAHKFWPPNADYAYWDNTSAAYMISELQRFSNEEIPIYTSKQVRQMKEELDTLNDKFTDQGLLIDNKNLQIETLESQLKEGDTQLDYHGDCESVTGGFECDDNITTFGGNLVYANCTDGERVILYCNPDFNHEYCVGKAEYPYGGPISGTEACTGA